MNQLRQRDCKLFPRRDRQKQVLMAASSATTPIQQLARHVAQLDSSVSGLLVAYGN